MSERRLRLAVEGLVQGVGFRPHVHRLAGELALSGWIRNGEGGVLIELQGEAGQLEAFLLRLSRDPPPLSRLERIGRQWCEPQAAGGGFRILPSPPPGERGRAAGEAVGLVLPDLAPCPACLAEIRDPAGRRRGYAFTSCVHCGPRYSVVRALPYERERTALAAFPLCPACRREYADPADRRFHAQTIACPHCGPRLRWHGADGGLAITDPAEPPPLDPGGRICPTPALAAAVAALRQGEIVALQGLGGFQLLVRARSGAAVAELRRRKARPDKPLALLAPDLAWVRRHCHLAPAEAALLSGAAAPIVLLRRREPARTPGVAAEVAPGLPWLGVMLPATPLHALLMEALGEPLVATSGNRSGEPLCWRPDEALERLAGLADGFLLHDRPILQPIDDAVAQVVDGEAMLLRHARGYAPTAIALVPCGADPQAIEGMVAVGGDQKGAFALGLGGRALLGPHLGDLGSESAERHRQVTLDAWLACHRLGPGRFAADRHPGYRSGAIARERAATPPRLVQHHHAHLLACLAEHGLAPPQVGVAFDGAGDGGDGTLWGGECLRLEGGGFRRLARLRPLPLPGAERAMREPRRAALGLLHAAFGAAALRQGLGGWQATRAAFSAEELEVLLQMLERNLQTPIASSAGRLFDGMASLLGIRQRCSHEGQAAMELEAAAWRALEHEGDGGAPPTVGGAPLAFVLREGSGGEPIELDWGPLLGALLAAREQGAEAETLALAFHRALAEALVALGQRLGLERLLLGGGCFQNRLLLQLSIHGLRRADIEPLWPRRIPCNDGGLALGQLLAAGLGPSG